MTLRATYAQKLLTCDERLQKIFFDVARSWDICVIFGHRNKLEQDIAFTQKKSKLRWPNSKHNKIPSLAADVIPLKNGKIDWQDIDLIKSFAEDVFIVAQKHGIKLTWGGDWKMRDYVHWELSDG